MDEQRPRLTPVRVLARVRIAIYVVVLASLGYLWWRFRVDRIPDGACSPVGVVQPGDQIVVDSHPGSFAIGDVLFFHAPGEGDSIFLGVVQPLPDDVSDAWRRAADEGGLWIVGDDPNCVGADSRVYGPIAPSLVVGRYLLTLPF